MKQTRNRVATQRKLEETLEQIILRDGAEGLGVNKLAAEADVSKALIYRYYGGLEGLVSHWVRERAHWPSAIELIGGDEEAFKRLAVKDKIKRTFVNYLREIRNRPVLVQVMAAQLMQPSDVTLAFEKASATISDDLTQLVSEIGSENLQKIVSLSILLISSCNYLAIRSTKHPVFYGLDLSTQSSWLHIEGIIEDVIDAYLESV